MAVSSLSDAYTLPTSPFRKRSLAEMQSPVSSVPPRWIDEEMYRTGVLSLYPPETEVEVDEHLERDARELGLSPVQKPVDVSDITSSLSATTIASDNHQGSILSQSTAPTSCGSSQRRPSTSLSNRSSRVYGDFETPSIVTELGYKRQSGFKNGLRKMTGFRKKRLGGSSTPSLISINSQTTDKNMNTSNRKSLKSTMSIKSGHSYSSHDSPAIKENFESESLMDNEAIHRSLQSDELLRLRTQQLEEKRRFLEYQTRLIRQLLDERDKQKASKVEEYSKRIDEQEEKNEKAVEELESRQLEDELKQQNEHESDKRAIHTRLKHMEAYCQTPSPPNSPLQATFDHRPSIDSVSTLPERQITQQHYENLAQAYHARDNMDALHASKINVLRGKQKRTLQSFMLRKEREIEQWEKERDKALSAIDLDFAKNEAEIRQEFEAKRVKLEARWKLQALIERTRLEKSTGHKYEGLPDIVALES